MPTVTKLHMQDNRIEHVPETLKSLQALTYLDLSNNCITNLQPMIGRLSNLKVGSHPLSMKRLMT